MAQLANKPRFAGTSVWTTSTGSEDLIATAKTQVGVTYLKAKILQFYNKADCKINVNNTQDILIPANTGIDLENVESFKIKTASVQYTCIIEY